LPVILLRLYYKCYGISTSGKQNGSGSNWWAVGIAWRKRQCIRDFIKKRERNWSLGKSRRRCLDIAMKLSKIGCECY
jgi:hypothetical protein